MLRTPIVLAEYLFHIFNLLFGHEKCTEYEFEYADLLRIAGSLDNLTHEYVVELEKILLTMNLTIFKYGRDDSDDPPNTQINMDDYRIVVSRHRPSWGRRRIPPRTLSKLIADADNGKTLPNKRVRSRFANDYWEGYEGMSKFERPKFKPPRLKAKASE